jgi:hypothetical protein
MIQTPLPGKFARAGSYEVLEKIGSGGMATVYKGRDPATGEVVAIKVLGAAAAANPILVERFKQEYRAASTLSHPHLVRALDHGVENGDHYLVLEFIHGEDLAQVIEHRGKLPEEEAVHLIGQVGQALQLAHDHQIIHRDVKPSNILVTSTGLAKLTDLGLVKDCQSNLDLTRPLVGMGTPNFMAPEQFGDAKHADPRCDVYSLGATLYTAVTAQVPFEGSSNLAILKKKLHNDLTPPRQLTPKLSLHVDLAIRRAMRADPTQRPASCREFLASLTQPMVLADAPARPAEPAALREGPGPGAAPRGAERRASVRYASRAEVTCAPLARTREATWAARIQDISASGLCLRLGRRFEPGTLLVVELRQPADRLCRFVLAQVRRARQLSPRAWSIGCSFEHLLLDYEVSAWM